MAAGMVDSAIITPYITALHPYLSVVSEYLLVQALVDDLARHFQISRNAEQIGCILVNLLKTDFSFGLAVDSLNTLRGNQDALLANMAQTEVRKFNLHNTM